MQPDLTHLLNAQLHGEIIKLVIAYTLLGAFMFTVIVTCLSLIGLVKFAVAGQQSKLFGTLIVELAVIGIGNFTDVLNFDARAVQKEIQAPAVQAAVKAETKAQFATENLNTQTQAIERLQLSDQVQNEIRKGLKPEAAELAQRLIDEAKLQGIDLRIIAGFRSVAEQDELYAQGRTKPGRIITNARGGYSNHNTGLCFDVGIFRDGRYVDDEEAYKKVGKIGKNLGLVWGGDWALIQDYPHFETRDAQQAFKALKSSLSADR